MFAVFHNLAVPAALAAILVVTLAGGCVGQKAYDTGCGYIENGEFDAAVRSYREAHDADPNNPEFYEAWRSATEQAIAWHRDEAANRFNKRMLRPARTHVDRAIGYCDADSEPIPGPDGSEFRTVCGVQKGAPHHPHSLNGVLEVNPDELIDLRRLIVRAIQGADRRADQGELHIRNGEWDEAVVALREATELDRSSTRASVLLGEAINGAVPHHLSLAERHLKAEEWEACRSECSVVLSYRPEDAEGRLLLDLAEKRARARTLQQKAIKLAQDGEYLSAIDTLERARTLWPHDTSIAKSQREIKDLTAEALIRESRECVAREAYRAALDLLDRAASLVPEQPSLLRAVTEAERRWADDLLREADDRLAQGQNELAWVLALQAAGVSGDHDGARQAMDRYAASVRAELDCAIAIVPAPNGGSHPQETVRACAMMTNALAAAAPPHLRIVERTNLSDILAEQDLARTDVLDPGALGRLAARMRNADLILFVSTTTRSDDTQQVERWAAHKQLTGTRLVRNPAFADAQAAVTATRLDLERAEKAHQQRQQALRGLWGDGDRPHQRVLNAAVYGIDVMSVQQAEDRYAAALVNVRRTPELVEVPNEQVYRYPVYRITRRATVTAEMRLIDVATSQVVWNEDTITHTVTRSDTYVKPEPKYGLSGKQALLPDPEHLYAEATEGLENKIQQAARAFLSRRAEAYLARARRAASPQTAAALFVQYLFDPGPQPAAASVQEALAAVVDFDIDTVRRARCRRFATARLGLASQLKPTPRPEVSEPEPRIAREPDRVPDTPTTAPTRREQDRPRFVSRDAVQLVLFDKKQRDKADAFGLVFDVDDVTDDGVDVRVSQPGTKGPKFKDLLAGREFEVLHVRGRVIEVDPDDERAVIEVWTAHRPR